MEKYNAVPITGETPDNKKPFRAGRDRENKDIEILAGFTPEEKAIIKDKQKVLSSLAYFIGKDFTIPVELNGPGEGWHWDFKNNIIRIDPKDMLEKPMDYLRFVISHEGGHRRISRIDFIPPEVWQKPGFSFMMKAIEDPRDNNFVAESYPKFREQMKLAYEQNIDFEAKGQENAKKKLGKNPRFMQAGVEYIKQWYRSIEGKPYEIDKSLPEEVKAVVQRTLASAQESWNRFPTRAMADGSEKDELGLTGEESITEHAKQSFTINHDKVWPEFKKLIEQDLEDQQMQEFLKDQSSSAEAPQDKPEKSEGGEQSGEKRKKELPKELKDTLSPEEQKELEEAIEKAMNDAQEEKQVGTQEGGKGEGEEKGDSGEGELGKLGAPSSAEVAPSKSQPIDLNSLSEGLQQKIKEYINSLSEEQKNELAERAKRALKDFEEELNKGLDGKLSKDPDQSGENAEQNQEEDNDENQKEAQISAGKKVTTGPIQKNPAEIPGLRVFSDTIRDVLERNANVYEEYRREMLPAIEKLESELRQIFIDQKSGAWKSGYAMGKRIDITKRIQEKAKKIPVIESKAWQKREIPKEKDYAFAILNDVSGSMAWDGKNTEDLKSKILLAEVLNRIGIDIEILGFNTEIIEYQKFGETITKKMREQIGTMLVTTEQKRCGSCKADHQATDIGWATEVAAERLSRRKAENKFLITISDYQFEESPSHPRAQYELGKIIQKVLKDTDIGVIGLGIGDNTENVEEYYPNSIPNIEAHDLPKKLAELIKRIVASAGAV